jgi:outer membrane receptor protein involved in Fe transport
MDPTHPVIYNFNPDAHGSDWMWIQSVSSTTPGYLEMNSYTAGKATWVDRNGDGVFNTPNLRWDQGEAYEDYNGNREWNSFDYFLNPGTWDGAAIYQDREQTEYTLKFNYQNQVSKHHTFTTGGQLKYSEMNMESIQNPDEPYTGEIPLPPGSLWPDRGAYRDFYDYKPYEGGLFFRDVMEFEGLIIKASLRWDFFIHDPNYLDLTEQLTQDYPYFSYQNRRGRYKFAPRLGISHPITRGSKLFFNYSHKYQRPLYSYFFAAATSNLANAGVVGNPDLEYEKTVEYELGVETEFSKFWLFKVSGYYKDIYNTMGTVPVVYGPLNFDIYSNTDYGRCKGVEFSIDKRFSQNYLVSAKYDFSFAEGKASSDVAAVQQRLQNVPVNHDEYPLGWDERHRINFYASIRFQKDEYPVFYGLRLPDDWLLTVQWEYGSGTPYTPSTYVTGQSSNLILPNSARYPWKEKTSLKFEKYFLLRKGGRTKVILGVDVDNLFDKKNINTLYSETGSPYYAIHPEDPNYDPYGNRNDYDANPRNFDPGRNVMFRIGFEF